MKIKSKNPIVKETYLIAWCYNFVIFLLFTSRETLWLLKSSFLSPLWRNMYFFKWVGAFLWRKTYNTKDHEARCNYTVTFFLWSTTFLHFVFFVRLLGAPEMKYSCTSFSSLFVEVWTKSTSEPQKIYSKRLRSSRPKALGLQRY